MRVRLPACVLIATLLALQVSPACADEDAVALQKQAIGEVAACRSSYLKTGDPLRTQLQQAKAELVQSITAFEARHDYAAEALSFITLAKIVGLLEMPPGSTASARLTGYRKAGQLAILGNNIDYAVIALTGMAAAQSQLMKVTDAVQSASAAVNLASRVSKKATLFLALAALADAEAKRKDFMAAGNDYNRAIDLSADVDDKAEVAGVYFSRGVMWSEDAMYVCSKDLSNERICNSLYQKARSDEQKAVVIAHGAGYNFIADQFRAANKEDEVNEARSSGAANLTDPAISFRYTKPSQVIYRQRFSPDPDPAIVNLARVGLAQVGRTDESRLAFAEGQRLEALGKNDDALKSYLRAVDLVEEQRNSLGVPASRTALAEDRIDIYYAAILELLDHHRLPEAFALMERSRSRAMADLLAVQHPLLRAPIERQLLAQSSELAARLDKEQQHLFDLAPGSTNDDEITKTRSNIRTLEAQAQAVQSRIATTAPELNNLIAPSPITLEDAQSRARRGRYDLLYYLTLPSGLIVWHINGDGVKVKRIYFVRELLDKHIADLRVSLNDAHADFDVRTAREMFLVLVNPVLDSITSHHLVIIPQGDLNLLPFQVLQNPADNSYLGERFAISYAPSATILAALDKQPNIKGGTLLALADPTIRSASDEVRAIAGLYPGKSKVVTNTLVTKKDVNAWTGNYNLVHISTHGRFDSSNPMLSALQLRPADSTDDGRYTAAEMFALPLQQNSLVVLSACETGRVEVTPGNEIIGMVRALLYAGATNVVLSNWAVDAASTKIWMETFYREAQLKPPSEAARLALLAVKRHPDYSKPFYWAPFMMTGG